jgi:hypothetical protein
MRNQRPSLTIKNESVKLQSKQAEKWRLGTIGKLETSLLQQAFSWVAGRFERPAYQSDYLFLTHRSSLITHYFCV